MDKNELFKIYSSYLPHNVKIEFETTMSWSTNLVGLSYNEGEEDFKIQSDRFNKNDKLSWGLSCYAKLILTPMSILQTMFLVDIENYLDCSHEQVQELMNFKSKDIKLNDISYGLYEAMCKKHIDFNDLIGKGLAIQN